MESALGTWNEKLGELWELLTQTPQNFKGGDIWNVIVGINGALQGIGYGLLVLFFAMGVFQSAASFREIQRPEYALRHFLRFAAAKVAVGSGMELMTAIFSICGGLVQAVMGGVGGAGRGAGAPPLRKYRRQRPGTAPGGRRRAGDGGEPFRLRGMRPETEKFAQSGQQSLAVVQAHGPRHTGEKDVPAGHA